MGALQSSAPMWYAAGAGEALALTFVARRDGPGRDHALPDLSGRQGEGRRVTQNQALSALLRLPVVLTSRPQQCPAAPGRDRLTGFAARTRLRHGQGQPRTPRTTPGRFPNTLTAPVSICRTRPFGRILVRRT